MDTHIRILLYKYLIPSPTDKLSKLTEKAKNKVPNKLSGLIFSSFSKKCINISIDNIKKTNPNINLGLNIVYSNKEIPIILPINGIKKWNIPTESEVNITFLILIFLIPYDNAKAKASILKLTAINIMFMMINHLPTLYYYKTFKNIFLIFLL